MTTKSVCCCSYFGSFERDGVLMIEMEYADGGMIRYYDNRVCVLLQLFW